MIFVDTGAWFAAVVPSDPNHRAAAAWLADNTEHLLTTDYVVDETLTLLRARGERTRALRLGEAFFGGGLAEIYRLTEDDIALAWETFRGFDDKDWRASRTARAGWSWSALASGRRSPSTITLNSSAP